MVWGPPNLLIVKVRLSTRVSCLLNVRSKLGIGCKQRAEYQERPRENGFLESLQSRLRDECVPKSHLADSPYFVADAIAPVRRPFANRDRPCERIRVRGRPLPFYLQGAASAAQVQSIRLERGRSQRGARFGSRPFGAFCGRSTALSAR